MKRLVLQCGLLGLLSLLAVSFGVAAPRPVRAADSTVGPVTSAFIVPGTWLASQVGIAAFVPASHSYSYDSIQITDQSYLRPGWIVKVGDEQMYVNELIEGGAGNPPPPDIMRVWRGWNGTQAVAHNQGRPIEAHTVTVDIRAQNVIDSHGLGAFGVYLTFPPETQYVKAVMDTTWLASTGRDPSWCDPTTHDLGGGVYYLACFTMGDPGNPGHPLGPTGSGLIARVTVLPPQSLGSTTVSLAGSFLADISGDNLSANVRNIVVQAINCPDANLDGIVSVGDLSLTAWNNSDQGVDSGATLFADVNTTSTSIQISQQGLLQVNDTISIDAEIMKVLQLIPGTPPSMVVSRANQGTPASTHKAGSHIYRGTVDGNLDGKIGYTWPRDVNHDSVISVSDLTIMARMSPLICPSPPP